jgi:hypothetical protein
VAIEMWLEVAHFVAEVAVSQVLLSRGRKEEPFGTSLRSKAQETGSCRPATA